MAFEHVPQTTSLHRTLKRPWRGFALSVLLQPRPKRCSCPTGAMTDCGSSLSRFTRTRKVSAGEALIRRGEPDRTLSFVLYGELEVIAHSGDGLSLGHVAMVSAGSVFRRASILRRQAPIGWCLGGGRLRSRSNEPGPVHRIRSEQPNPRTRPSLCPRPDTRDAAAQDYCESHRVKLLGP